MLLTSAERLGAFGLHARLRETHAMKEESVNTNTIPDTSAVLAKILDEGVPEPREATGDQTAEQSASVKLTHDPESTELFLMEMATHANERGEFSAKQGVEVLRSQFGFPQVEHKEDHGAWNQAYNALWRLSRLGKLEKLEFGYRIPHTSQGPDLRPRGLAKSPQPRGVSR